MGGIHECVRVLVGVKTMRYCTTVQWILGLKIVLVHSLSCGNILCVVSCFYDSMLASISPIFCLEPFVSWQDFGNFAKYNHEIHDFEPNPERQWTSIKRRHILRGNYQVHRIQTRNHLPIDHSTAEARAANWYLHMTMGSPWELHTHDITSNELNNV